MDMISLYLKLTRKLEEAENLETLPRLCIMSVEERMVKVELTAEQTTNGLAGS